MACGVYTGSGYMGFIQQRLLGKSFSRLIRSVSGGRHKHFYQLLLFESHTLATVQYTGFLQQKLFESPHFAQVQN